MQGQVIEVLVTKGQEVAQETEVLVIEAMKMETVVAAEAIP